MPFSVSEALLETDSRGQDPQGVLCLPLNWIENSPNEFESKGDALLGWLLRLRSLICRAEDSATTEVSNPSKNCPNKAIIIAFRFGVKMPKASLIKEKYGSASLEIIRERSVMVPCLAYPFFNARHEVEITLSVVGVIREREFIDLGPPASIGTWDLDIGFIHSRNITD